MAVKLKETVFNRWIIVDANEPTRGWSGSRFVEIDERGLGKFVQVCNFSDRKIAVQYARLCGLEVLEE